MTIDDKSHMDDIEMVGICMQELWRNLAKQSRIATTPATRSYFGAQAAGIIHLALLLNTKISGFEDYVPEFRDKGLLR